MVNISPALELVKRFEGFSSKPYLCPAKIPTIGYGSTYYPGGRRVTLNDPPISREEAMEILKYEMLNTFLPGVIRNCPILFAKAVMEDDIYKLCAILDFAYNLGVGNLQISTLRKKINSQDWAEVPNQLRRWNKAGGKVLRGLTLRREAEIELFNTIKEK